ncbi:MAG: DUF6605 domain-containing protein [Bryobacteraceae bacterium]
MHASALGAQLLLCFVPAAAQVQASFLQEAFGTHSESALLSPKFPKLSLNLVNIPVTVKARLGENDATLAAPGSAIELRARYTHEGAFEVCRISPEPGSSQAADELKLIWAFPMEYNESMTLDAGALEGHPLYLPDGTTPPAHHLNWGTLFYDRSDNLALGTVLEGAQAASSQWGARTGPSGPTQLHFWTLTGKPDLQLTIFAYRPRDARLWWAEWYQEQERRAPRTHVGLFPVVSPLETSWGPGERQRIQIVPGPAEAGKAMEFLLIDDVRGKIAFRLPFTYRLPVTGVDVNVGDWTSGLYRGVVVPAGAAVDPATRDLNQKVLSLIVRPRRAGGVILFVAPTDMWRAYASNGGHAMTSWRDAWHYDSVGYSPTVLNTRFRRSNHYYYGLYERWSDIQHYQFLANLAQDQGLSIDYCTQDDIALGRVRLSDYRLVLVGNHAEFTTLETFLSFRDYLAHGGAVMIHGGDSFAVIVKYLPSLQDRRYIWQNDHVWCHLTYQSDDWKPPQLVGPNASTDAPITPDAGDTIDYLNIFHVSVGYWPAGSRAVISNIDHPVTRGLGLQMGQDVPGKWAGESDIAYEPGAWDVLIRSEQAATEAGENFLERVKQPPFHRPGLAVHRNLRLALIASESYTDRLADPNNPLFRTLYVRTLRYLLDTPVLPGDEALKAEQRDGAFEFKLNSPGTLTAIQYDLPDMTHYADPLWFRKPAPYAHYVVEGSEDGAQWSVLADRTHGPWRGLQTDYVRAGKLSKLRLRGSESNGGTFEVKNLRIFRAR